MRFPRYWYLGFLFLIIMFAPAVLAGNPRGHWSFPGDIRTHLQQGHGQQTAGLSYEQMLNLHDQLHTSGRTFSSQRKVSRPVYRFRLFRR